MYNIRTTLVCAGIVLSLRSHAQHIPMGELPMLLNGGFAGVYENNRINAGVSLYNHSRQDIASFRPPQMRKEFANVYYTSFDQFFKKLGVGVGFTYGHDHSQYSYQSVSYSQDRDYFLLSISPKFSFKGKYTLAPFVDASYTNIDGNLTEMHDQMPFGNFTNVRTGLLFNTKKFYAGMTFYVWKNDARIQFYPKFFSSDEATSAFALVAGYTFQQSEASNFSFTPQAAYLRHIDSFEFQVNLMFRYKKFIWSINNNGLGLGVQHKKIRVMVSQSYMLVNLFDWWSGSVTVRYIFK